MLVQRVITGAILIALVLLVLFVLPASVFLFLSALVMLYAAWEWTNFMSLNTLFTRLAYIVLIFLVALLLYANVMAIYIFIMVTFVWWLVHVLLVVSYPSTTMIWASRPVQGLTGVLLLVSCWFSVLTIDLVTPWLVLALFLIIWGTDICAYFSGRAWGKKKLLPHVSPGKTWAGFWGALVSAIVLGLIFICVVPEFRQAKVFVFVLTIVTMLFSVLGDLVESMYKRNAGIKDSGKLLPGHGGLLDRIDSLTAAAPIFLLGMYTYTALYGA